MARSLRSWLKRRLSPARPIRRRSAQLGLLALEQRDVPATFTVETPFDVVDPNDGVLSLREAIAEANASTDAANTVIVPGLGGGAPASSYLLTDGQLLIKPENTTNRSITVLGNGSALDNLTNPTVITAHQPALGGTPFRVFDVQDYVGDQPLSVTFQGLTIQGGSVKGTVPQTDARGGGIRFVASLSQNNVPNSDNHLTIANCEISNNSAFGADGSGANSIPGGDALGGAIYSQNLYLTVTDSVLHHNGAVGAFGGGSAYGGAVDHAGRTVKFSNVKIHDNVALGGSSEETDYYPITRLAGEAFGGGVLASISSVLYPSDTFLMTDSEVEFNLAKAGDVTAVPDEFGGGPVVGANAVGGGMRVAAENSAAVRSTFDYNQAIGGAIQGENETQGGTAGEGWAGGVQVHTLYDCTIYHNTATGGGGFVPTSPNLGGSPGDPGVGRGGGTAFYAFDADLSYQEVLYNCTVAYNEANGGSQVSGGTPAAGYGGGVYGSDGPGDPVVTLYSSIVANNSVTPTGATGRGPDVYLGDTLGYNLIRNNDGAGNFPSNIVLNNPVPNANHDLVGTPSIQVDPLLDLTPSYNGGLTKTFALPAGSPAIDLGQNSATPPAGVSLAYDQRDNPFRRTVAQTTGTPNGDRTDAGAFEVQAQSPPIVLGLLVNDGQVQRSEVRSITVTFSTLVTPANTWQDAIHLTNNASPTSLVGFSADDQLLSTQTQTVVRLTFSGSGTDALTQNGGPVSLADGVYTLTVLGSQVTATIGGANLDGDENGFAGGNYVSPTDTGGVGTAGYHFGLYRKYGDGDGNGRVNDDDLNLFRRTFNLTYGAVGFLDFFDSENNDMIDLLDLQQFRLRNGTSFFP